LKTFADFQAAFPKLYREVRCGFSCPEGWLDIVWRLSEKLEPLGVECAQVKEKFGALRFYLEDDRGLVTAASKLILSAELEADHTCEICGKQPAKLGNWKAHYVRTLCEEHIPADVEQNVPRTLTEGADFTPGFLGSPTGEKKP
jgi:hypothetical protein